MAWVSEKQKEAEKAYLERAERDLMFGIQPPEPSKPCRVFAKILVNNDEILALMDKKTMKAYEIGEGYEETNKEIKDFTFVRWGRPMDV